MFLSASPTMMERFTHGGGWVYPIALWIIVFYILLAVQYAKRRQVDFTPILWGLLASLAMLGPLATALGISGAGYALELAADEWRLEAMSKGIAVSMHTTVFSHLFAVIGAILLGVVTFKVKQASAES